MTIGASPSGSRPLLPALPVLAVLAVVLAATRLHHFSGIPDASWAVFFLGGFHLARQTRWAFPLLMALAVAVDLIVITRQGLDFWEHACASPAYWFLLPAYFSLWAGGLWLRRQYRQGLWRALAWLLPTLVAAVIVCHMVAQGSFYWIGGGIVEPTLSGWWKNYRDWLPSYLGVTAIYTGIGIAAHLLVGLIRAARQRTTGDQRPGGLDD